jgi:hypothetical protein
MHLRALTERDKMAYQAWKAVVKRVTHERALWPREVERWQLDPTEGLHRQRIRLKPLTKVRLEFSPSGLPILPNRSRDSRRPLLLSSDAVVRRRRSEDWLDKYAAVLACVCACVDCFISDEATATP